MIHVSPISAFSDNYIWSITKDSDRRCYLVDPGDPAVCINWLEENQRILAGILVTHHHWDHTDGISALVDYANIQNSAIDVFGPDSQKIDAITVKLAHGDSVQLFDSICLDVIELPGHTLDHIGYYGADVLFCGDTLFSGGCGRLFEGTPEQMFNSLTKLKLLPEKTKVYCTHEYTLANLAFAQVVNPTNNHLIEYVARVKRLRNNNLASLPTTIKQELAINPFLRTEDDEVKKSVDQNFNKVTLSDIEIFAQLRKWKDNF